MNTASVTPQMADKPLLVVTSDEAHTTGGGNYSDDAIIARAERLIALRDLHLAKRRHMATAGIMARLRAATARAML